MSDPSEIVGMVASELHAERRESRIGWVVAAAFGLVVVCLLVVSVVYSVATMNRDTAILKVIDAQTSPAKVHADQAQLRSVIREVVDCVDNHSDRAVAKAIGAPVPPLRPGCPK